ncbi:hypothetical protein CWB85_07070 [Pseudoalteromonas sp. S1727]|uniref:restriction endonuclease subunit S n=1 Tax=Pseudoalteromonas sp. S1727 TaxID=2066514 RepID=UPI0011098A28|nr:restriction endonuclease subunit S [Pseudoalteromonas sp. S1727]TMN72558.1 hypothetical protein CWB85_07070 [Pseudoalteromonas sp. S1727]
MSKVIPNDWSRAKLGDYIGVQGGNAFKSEYFSDNGVPIIRISNIKKDGSVNLKGAVYFEKDSNLAKFKAIKGDILIAMSGATTGKVGRYKSDVFSYINQRVGRFFLKKTNEGCIDFIHQITSEDEFTNSVLIDAVGGAQPNISNQQIESILVNFPPLYEQQKIAKILTSVDEVIEKTQAQIDKLKDLKTGMMQELLTNGIGHTEFKDSPVGRIPAEWDVVTLGDITVESAFGPRFSSDEYASNGNFGCIRTTDMDDSWDINYSTAPLARLCYEEFKKHILVDDDLLVTRSGTCGLVDVFREQPIPMIAAAFLIRFRLNESMNPFFVKYLMMSATIQEKVQLLASGGVQQNLSATSLKTLKIPKPSIKEQKKIIKVIESINNRLADTKKKLSLNIKLKKALMQDLLTGKVRVKVDSE